MRSVSDNYYVKSVRICLCNYFVNTLHRRTRSVYNSFAALLYNLYIRFTHSVRTNKNFIRKYFVYAANTIHAFFFQLLYNSFVMQKSAYRTNRRIFYRKHNGSFYPAAKAVILGKYYLQSFLPSNCYFLFFHLLFIT